MIYLKDFITGIVLWFNHVLWYYIIVMGVILIYYLVRISKWYKRPDNNQEKKDNKQQAHLSIKCQGELV